MSHASSARPVLPAGQKINPDMFRAYDIRGIADHDLTTEAAYYIGRAFAEKLGSNPTVCIGYDGRVSSPSLEAAAVRGLVDGGAKVIRIGLGPTPMLYFSVVTRKAQGGIMLTGSHNPPDHNGFKLMIGNAPFYGNDITALGRRVTDLANSETLPTDLSMLPQSDAIESVDIKEEYLTALTDAYKPGRELAIAWDCGNGAAGEIVAKLCARLPGKHTPMYSDIDGTFPNHHPDPTEPENLEHLIKTVRDGGYDAGIAFDGDGDRIGVVDDKGNIIWGDQLLMLYATELLKRQPGATILADVKASKVLFDHIKQEGGQPLMWKTGHSHIKSKMKELKAPLAGEMSGHVFFADNYYGFDDAIYAAVRVLSILTQMQTPLSDWVAALPTLSATPEVRFDCPESRKFAIIEEIAARLNAEKAEFSDVDGVRVNRDKGWWLLRASNTQPMLSARVEATDPAALEALKAELAEQLTASGLESIPAGLRAA